MTNIAKIKERKGTWLWVAPVRNIVLEPAVNKEIRINKVTLVDVDRLANVRRRLGFPYTLNKTKRLTKNNDFFTQAQTYAVCKLSGKGTEKEPEFIQLARDELNLLSLSQLGFGRRRNYAHLALASESPAGRLHYFMTETSGDKLGWVMKGTISGRYSILHLGDQWLQFQRHTHFFELLKVIRGEKNVSNAWRRDIKNAAIMAGKSQSSAELDHAFLWNMIAIETLLTHQGDSYSTELPKRAEAFIGWSTDWPAQNYEGRIKEIYKKRCGLVHAGRKDNLTIKDLLFTDNLLLNVFHNILRHLDIFSSKGKLIEFSKKVEAEHLLGMQSRVRPKTLSFIKIKYSDRDYTEV